MADDRPSKDDVVLQAIAQRMIDATRKCTETGIKQAQVSANIRGMEELIETHDVEHQKAERLAAECRMSIYGHDDN